MVENAQRQCQEHRRHADEERTARIRKTQGVKRVLKSSPTYAEYVLTEAYPADPAEGLLTPTWYELPLREGALKLDHRCPSLASLIERLVFCGSMPGHQNALYLIDDVDWDLCS